MNFGLLAERVMHDIEAASAPKNKKEFLAEHILRKLGLPKKIREDLIYDCLLLLRGLCLWLFRCWISLRVLYFF